MKEDSDVDEPPVTTKRSTSISKENDEYSDIFKFGAEDAIRVIQRTGVNMERTYKDKGNMLKFEKLKEFGSVKYCGHINKETKERQGFGIAVMEDGKVYEGFWEKDKMEGHGRMTYKNGSQYTGDWLKGKRWGYGTYRKKDGALFEGDWEEDEIEGDGK